MKTTSALEEILYRLLLRHKNRTELNVWDEKLEVACVVKEIKDWSTKEG